MDIAATSVLAQQLQAGRLELGTAVLKSAIKTEQQTAAILVNAVAAAGPADGSRGTQLDISV